MARKYEDESYVRKLYEEYSAEFLTLKELGARHGLDYARVSNAFKRFGLEVRTNSAYRTTTPNHLFFSDIRTEIQAYLLGFFASDGHIERRKDYKSFSLKWDIQERDVELLDLVNKYIGNDTYNVYKCEDRPIVGIAISSTQIGLDLLRLGYDNHKTRTCDKLPELPQELMRHFLRGYFDGDGSVSVSKAKEGYNRVLSFAALSRHILEQIEQILPKEYKSYIRHQDHLMFGTHRAQCHTLSYHSRHDIKLISDYFYADASFYLKRKYEKCKKAALTAKEIAALEGNLHRTSGELLETP